VRCKIQTADQTKQNKNIGNDGSERQFSNMSNQYQGHDKNQGKPDVILLIDLRTTMGQHIHNIDQIARDEYKVGAHKPHLRYHYKEEYNVFDPSTKQHLANITVGTANHQLRVD